MSVSLLALVVTVCVLWRVLKATKGVRWMAPHSACRILACPKAGKAGAAPAREPVSCPRVEFAPNKNLAFSVAEMFLLASAKPKM